MKGVAEDPLWISLLDKAVKVSKIMPAALGAATVLSYALITLGSSVTAAARGSQRVVPRASEADAVARARRYEEVKAGLTEAWNHDPDPKKPEFRAWAEMLGGAVFPVPAGTEVETFELPATLRYVSAVFIDTTPVSPKRLTAHSNKDGTSKLSLGAPVKGPAVVTVLPAGVLGIPTPEGPTQ